MKNFIAGQEQTIQGRKWKWIDRVLRMDDTRICTTALTWQPESWKAKNNMEEDYRAGKNRARMEHLGLCEGSGKR
jgi:hypothetical protein